MSTPTDRLIRRYWTAMVGAVSQYEEQKKVYADVKQAYADRHPRDLVTADTKAAGDPRVVRASALAGWYRDEAAMYAAVITALRADEPVRPSQNGGGI